MSEQHPLLGTERVDSIGDMLDLTARQPQPSREVNSRDSRKNAGIHAVAGSELQRDHER